MTARLNVYWFLAFIAPALIMLVAASWRRWSVLVPAAALSLIVTYALCNNAVDRKWRLRNERAVTAEELDRAQADGANRVFTAFITAPFEAVLYTVLWGFIGWNRSPSPSRDDRLPV